MTAGLWANLALLLFFENFADPQGPQAVESRGDGDEIEEDSDVDEEDCDDDEEDMASEDEGEEWEEARHGYFR